MRKVVLALMALGLITVSCSKDDEPSKKCDTCDSSEGTKVEICDLGNGKYELTLGGVATQELTAEQLGNMSPEEYAQEVCNSL
ncbi:hypothetical protein [Flagellimonas zhangzhouensis]|uniref:Uncharacterized protein n=1 Tax=Flagellimonas zhangzhouensis TaxID=1073328 RepID=A0A1H2UUW4_9FLAO|nr:hypothetical protein [Allomuricauda zhangzhouensis]SDQ13326.1 hypothetical protein SAMN05216294_0513 [Allomuricauda zhangzhouensis]SDW59937.1 hypothetical protein SAMN04487892_1779 [Allomuricauda zhangzhouensis]